MSSFSDSISSDSPDFEKSQLSSQLQNLKASQANQSIYKLEYDKNITDQSKNSRSPNPVTPESQIPFSYDDEIVHEANTDDISGSEDVELILPRYERYSYYYDHPYRRFYDNKLSLAAELLQTEKKISYDDEFEICSVDSINKTTKVQQSENEKTSLSTTEKTPLVAPMFDTSTENKETSEEMAGDISMAIHSNKLDNQLDHRIVLEIINQNMQKRQFGAMENIDSITNNTSEKDKSLNIAEIMEENETKPADNQDSHIMSKFHILSLLNNQLQESNNSSGKHLYNDICSETNNNKSPSSVTPKSHAYDEVIQEANDFNSISKDVELNISTRGDTLENKMKLALERLENIIVKHTSDNSTDHLKNSRSSSLVAPKSHAYDAVIIQEDNDFNSISMDVELNISTRGDTWENKFKLAVERLENIIAKHTSDNSTDQSKNSRSFSPVTPKSHAYDEVIIQEANDFNSIIKDVELDFSTRWDTLHYKLKLEKEKLENIIAKHTSDNSTDQSENSSSSSPVTPESQIPFRFGYEDVIYEANNDDDSGSEEVELIPHRYESESYLYSLENERIHENKLSLASELLQTEENLPYDGEFKRIAGDQNVIPIVQSSEK